MSWGYYQSSNLSQMKEDKWDSLRGMCFDQDQFQVQTALCTKSADKNVSLQIHMQIIIKLEPPSLLKSPWGSGLKTPVTDWFFYAMTLHSSSVTRCFQTVSCDFMLYTHSWHDELDAFCRAIKCNLPKTSRVKLNLQMHPNSYNSTPQSLVNLL